MNKMYRSLLVLASLALAVSASAFAASPPMAVPALTYASPVSVEPVMAKHAPLAAMVTDEFRAIDLAMHVRHRTNSGERMWIIAAAAAPAVTDASINLVGIDADREAEAQSSGT